MPVPTHDITCKTRATSMQCNHCEKMVWYFSCTCGSKVFFNELGFPWEIHHCKEYAIKTELELLVDIEKMTPEEIYKIIINREKKSSVLIDEKIFDVIQSVIGRRKSKLEIKMVDPIATKIEVSGKVMEYNDTINIFTRLGYDAKMPMSIKLIERLAITKWAYARIRTNPNRLNQCFEHEVLICKDYIKLNKIKKNDFIIGIAEGVQHAKGIFWKLLKHDVY